MRKDETGAPRVTPVPNTGLDDTTTGAERIAAERAEIVRMVWQVLGMMRDSLDDLHRLMKLQLLLRDLCAAIRHLDDEASNMADRLS